MSSATVPLMFLLHADMNILGSKDAKQIRCYNCNNHVSSYVYANEAASNFSD